MEDNKKQKKLYRILVTIAITIPIVIAISYAYFQAAILGEDPGVTGKSTDKFEIDLVTENNGYINATNVILVKEANIASESEKGYFKVVSGDNKNYINYSLSLTELTISANLQVADFKWQLVRDNEVVASGNFGGVSTNSMSLINDIQIANNDTHEYEFRIWLQETSYDQIDMIGGTFSAKITMTANLRYNPVPLTLRNAILWQEDGTSAIISKGNPNFSNVATISDTGLYATEDEYGTSYYYRGVKAELNNNLIWGGFQWKIIRINGDGSVRLIYNGTEEEYNQNETVNNLDNTYVFLRPWNENYNNDAKYVGYMYGGTNGVASESREEAIRNETSSKLKSKLEEWYHDNIELNDLSGQVVDNLFCNDRSLTNTDYSGYGIDNTYFDAEMRIMESTIAPTLKCISKNDRFTVNDTFIGNGKLDYPIGLITIDEAAMAGLVIGTNGSTNYLYNNDHYWTFTPSFIDEGHAFVMRVSSNGAIECSTVNNEGLAVRPAISINGNIIVTGTGSADDPFIVVS